MNISFLLVSLCENNPLTQANQVTLSCLTKTNNYSATESSNLAPFWGETVIFWV